jgi:hypothetical protein
MLNALPLFDTASVCLLGAICNTEDTVWLFLAAFNKGRSVSTEFQPSDAFIRGTF